MDCQEFEDRLQEILDERLDPRVPALAAHAASCEACRESLKSAIILLTGVAAWRRTVPVVDLVDKVELQEQSTAKSRSSNVIRPEAVHPKGGVFSWVLASATAVAMCFMFWSVPFQQESHSTIRGLAKSKSVSPPIEQSAPLKTDLKTALASAEGAYSHLAQETVAVAHDFAMLMPTGGLFQTSESLETGNKPSPSNAPGLLPTNVYPVGDSVENALQYLWQSMPKSNERGA